MNFGRAELPNWVIAPAAAGDLEDVAALVNSAYRGDSSRAGWTTEADYIDGQRTSAPDLRRELAQHPGAQILLLRRSGDPEILACVLVEPAERADGGFSGYIGMLTVRPGLQDQGLGRLMLRAAEREARRIGADRARMQVVSIRDSLIDWYERRGYRHTGETKPFPYDDSRFGTPLRADLAFVVLEKPLLEAAG